MNEDQKLTEIENVISAWKLNKVVLASKMGMPTTTFKNKLNPNQQIYRLTDEEQERLINVLKELKSDLDNIITH